MTRLIAMVALVAACCVTQAAPVVPDVVCTSAYHRLRAMDCDLQRTDKGATFEVVCQHYSRQNIDIGAACVARSNSCIEAASCK